MTKKIAIIGSGISGLGVAYALFKSGYDVQVFEANDYVGGHSRTIDIETSQGKTSVDTGFIVYNNRNYPHLSALFNHLDIKTEKSDMSFGVDIAKGFLSYSSSAMLSLNNLKRREYGKMLWDILRFNHTASRILKEKDDAITLGQMMDNMKVGQWFRQYYLQAMGAAIWSTPLKKMAEFPARTFVQFFKNHGLLTIFRQPQWRTVTGGSRQYTSKIVKLLAQRIHLNAAVLKIVVSRDKYLLRTSSGDHQGFDDIIFACHANQALSILEISDMADKKHKDILGAFSYQKNHIIVHRDVNFMPQDRNHWASWVYLSDKQDNKDCLSLTYWMNNLQNLTCVEDILITLNPDKDPQATHTYDRHTFYHPIFNQQAVEAQAKIDDIQGSKNFWFVGAYQRYGFHEDGLLSAVRVLEKMTVPLPWK